MEIFKKNFDRIFRMVAIVATSSSFNRDEGILLRPYTQKLN